MSMRIVCQRCNRTIKDSSDRPLEELVAEAREEGALIEGNVLDPDKTVCPHCVRGEQWRRGPEFADGAWASWAGTGPAASLIGDSNDRRAMSELRDCFDSAVLEQLREIDPRSLSDRERSQAIAEAKEVVDVEDLARMVAMDNDLWPPRKGGAV